MTKIYLYKTIKYRKTNHIQGENMWLVFLIAIIFIGLFFSKIEIIFSKFEFYKRSLDYDILFIIKVFGVLPIFTVKVCNDSFRVFGKNYSNKKRFDILKIDMYIKRIQKIFSDKDFDIMDAKRKLEFFKNIKLESADIDVKIGLEDIFLTNSFVVLISYLLSLFFKEKIDKKNFKHIKYRILPEFNEVKFIANGKMKFYVSTRAFLTEALKIKKNDFSIKKFERIAN